MVDEPQLPFLDGEDLVQAEAGITCEGPADQVIAKSTGLEKDSVANVTQIVTLDRDVLAERVGRISKRQLDLVFAGLDLVLGR